MSVRTVLNRHGRMVLVGVVALMGLCAWVTWSQAHPDIGRKPPTVGYFTLDDGKSWFVGNLNTLTTLDGQGSPSVRAHVYQCADGTPAVGYLERYTQQWWDLHEKYRDEPQPPPGTRPKWVDEFAALGAGSLEVKRPGDAQWVSMADPASCDITSYTCKGGASAFELQPPPPDASMKAHTAGM